MDAKLTRIKELIDEKERIDGELDALLGGAAPAPIAKPRMCKKCGQPGHNAASCTAPTIEEPTLPMTPPIRPPSNGPM